MLMSSNRRVWSIATTIGVVRGLAAVRKVNPRTLVASRKQGARTAKAVVMASAATVSEASIASEPSSSLEDFAARADLSWLQQLSEDPEARRYEPNRSSREVKSGHFVRVVPTKLPSPELLMYSEELAAEMGLSAAAVADPRFARFVSGDTEALDLGGSWATPYALSIMGQEMYNNCPFGNGNGYGDGRAVSIGEVVVEGRRYELQLKGGGKTPFCRGADGRAVLRSSLREFLASEAMHFMGVPTTRALSLVVSRGETAQRGWYSGSSKDSITESDSRLAHLPLEVRRQLVRELAGRMDVAIDEPAAITCRVAPSFVRIGHLDLFARRAAASLRTQNDDDARSKELRDVVAHAIFREYADLWSPGLAEDSAALKSAALAMAERARDNLARLASNWLRVGFCQGNFNADNCLVAGRTMDYGPFGFMDRYDPAFAKWVGSGEHFAFAAQPKAAQVNFGTLVKSLLPLFAGDEDAIARLRALVETSGPVFQRAVDDCYARKLGFPEATDPTASLWRNLEPVLRLGLDYTIAFRELATFDARRVVDRALYPGEVDAADVEARLAAWIRDWRRELENVDVSPEQAAVAMNAVNPKYVLREWMLVQAYTAAAQGDLSIARDLYQLVKRPFDEHSGKLEAAYYRRADLDDLSKPGTAFMT